MLVTKIFKQSPSESEFCGYRLSFKTNYKTLNNKKVLTLIHDLDNNLTIKIKFLSKYIIKNQVNQLNKTLLV